MLVGSDIASATVAIDALDVDGIGLNCATGPAEMAEHIKWLGEHYRGLHLGDAQRGAADAGRRQDRISAAAAGVRRLACALPRRRRHQSRRRLLRHDAGAHPRSAQDARRARGEAGAPEAEGAQSRMDAAGVVAVHGATDLRQENALFAVGERSNANGSKLFRDKLGVEDWDALTAIGRDQVKDGSHAIDVCTAYVGRPEASDMTEVIKRYRGSVAAPLVIDSTELPVHGNRAQADRRQVDHQLDQLRGRRGEGARRS